MNNMSDFELKQNYAFYVGTVADNTAFCKEHGYYGEFGHNDYCRLKAENELLKLEIEMMKRKFI